MHIACLFLQERSGAGQGSFYHHFAGKADLAATALGEVAAEMQEDLKEMTIRFLGEKIFRGTPVPLEETHQPTLEGALAALERFYQGFNERSLEVLRQNWLETSLAQLDNPIGGIKRGLPAILEVYTHIFAGTARVRVEFFDVVTYLSSTMVVFAGRERGTYEQNGNTAPLDIRTTRIFAYLPEQGGWRQVHHHGSIDSTEHLARYVRAIRGS